MTDYVFTPGEYRTRHGHKAVIVAQVGDEWLGYIEYGDGGHRSPQWWSLAGKRWDNGVDDIDPLPPSPPVPETVTRWALLWLSDDGLPQQSGLFARRDVTWCGRKPDGAHLVVFRIGRPDTEDTPSDYDRGWNEALEAAEADFAKKGWGGPKPGWPIEVVRALKRSAP